jgi:hypothetical protein
MDPLTLGVVGLVLLILILCSLAIRAKARGPNILSMVGTYEPDQVQSRSMRDILPSIRINELLALRALSVVGVPLLMIVFSVAVPALRNPVFLMMGALVGFLLPGAWLSGSTFGRFALVAVTAVFVIFWLWMFWPSITLWWVNR